MGVFTLPEKGALKAYVRTQSHGVDVADWVSSACGINVTYDTEKPVWTYEGDSKVVASAFEELGRRILYQRVTFEKASPSVVSMVRNRVIRLRIGTPQLSITTKPDIFKNDRHEKPTKMTVFVVALPSRAYAFSEAACEVQALLDRFTVTVWRPTSRMEVFEEDDARRAFVEKHGIASVSRLRADGTAVMLGSAESIACGIEELGNTGVIVRKVVDKTAK